MDKRFVNFIVVAIAILLGYKLLEKQIAPPLQPPADAEQQANDVPALGNQPEALRTEASENADAVATADATADAEVTGALEGTAEWQEDAVAARPDEAWTTLGTLDHSRPEKMLVWFSNRGAAIECIALNDTRYTDLDDRHGYLGYLALRDTADGCRVGAAGQGTPAGDATPAAASQPIGLQAGDILEQIDETPIATSADYQAWAEQTTPAQQVRIRVRRQVDGQWQSVDYSAQLDHRPLEIIRPEPDKPSAIDPPHPLSFLLGLQQLGTNDTDFTDGLNFRVDELAGLPSLKRETWEMRPIEQNGVPGVEFHFVLSPRQLQSFGVTGPLRIIKRYTIARPASDENDEGANGRFHLNYEVIFRNEGSDGPPIKFSYQQNGPNGLPLEGWWYTYKTHPTSFGGAGVRDIVFKAAKGRHEMYTNPKIVDRIDDPNPMTLMLKETDDPVLDYIGVDSQYFLSALLPNPEDVKATPERYRLADAMAMAVAPMNKTKESLTDVSFRFINPEQTLGPQEEFSQRFLIFAGPKHPEVLKQYGLQECITYGWFRVVAKPLQWVLHAFYAVFRNYGIAIILLTVLVRGLMFPVGRQQAMNAQKMQELAPEMRRIAEQHKNDMEKRAAAQRELFRKHNYNPMAGCLPMFFQLPIFIGLYRALSVDIELRQAPLIPGLQWCSNLAGPDQLYYWESLSFMPAMLVSRTGWLGPYLNILPLVSVAFMMVHQKMFTPPPTDEQQEMQQRMMKFMMMFFALMFFRVPAGLCLYFITSSAWGLAERKLLPKSKTHAAAGGRETKGLLQKVLTNNGAQAPANKRRSKTRRR